MNRAGKGPTFTTEEKNIILRLFIQQFEKEMEILAESAKSAHEAATHAESKAEDSHDTRGLEASYLAGAQTARISKLSDVIRIYKLLLESNVRPMNHIAVGSLICLQLLNDETSAPKGRPILALFAADGGGTSISTPHGTVSVISSTSPLGELLIGAKTGDQLTLESPAGDRLYRVESVS